MCHYRLLTVVDNGVLAQLSYNSLLSHLVVVGAVSIIAVSIYKDALFLYRSGGGR